ncbi:amidohydrolase [Kordiimonas sp. SCSIO 12610]|uniref:amidohydrolase n=1 Tax=Kordiimonas sp. SCSIO 12610 TaxID=2829597 RepID=UPI00210A9BF5|nr:amidohydrolase family protein [Kordiimonas sp. SCSIO 12610]UTW56128.1 amidohydrolase family protein [Kordiimonas sp. SCSIO 12610]
MANAAPERSGTSETPEAKQKQSKPRKPGMLRIFGRMLLGVIAVIVAYTAWQYIKPDPRDTETLIHAKGVITLDKTLPNAEAIVMQHGMIKAVGAFDELAATYPNAKIDDRYKDAYLAPGFIDPHVHMLLSALQYSLPMAPPWDLETPNGLVRGLSNRDSFLGRIQEIADAHSADDKDTPLVIYGFHDLVHGDLTHSDLDAITSERPLFVWHYSSHDFYLNKKALEWAGITPDLHNKFEGVVLDANGALTGRVFEDALPLLFEKLQSHLFAPLKIRESMLGVSDMLRRSGVTTVADLGYGILNRSAEDLNITVNWWSVDHSGYRLYLVPEHRAFTREFGDDRVGTIKAMLAGDISTPAPILSQVKFFTDAAFYSQTMRLSEPGYLGGQSKGTLGHWVITPDRLADTIKPYWDAGLGVRIHSNGDAAQAATLDALEILRASPTAPNPNGRFIIEHAGIVMPDQVERAANLQAGISAASHYVHYLGGVYQDILGSERGQSISPLKSLMKLGVPTTLHSDAPLAPPLPLKAASVHMLRSMREGGVLNAGEQLSRAEALRAITVDAAYALGLEGEIGMIKPGMRADFTILGANPMTAAPKDWPDIEIIGTIVDGIEH